MLYVSSFVYHGGYHHPSYNFSAGTVNSGSGNTVATADEELEPFNGEPVVAKRRSSRLSFDSAVRNFRADMPKSPQET